MGLVSKLKNILFEEEEVEIPVIEKKEKKPEVVREYKELPKKEEVKSFRNKAPFFLPCQYRAGIPSSVLF